MVKETFAEFRMIFVSIFFGWKVKLLGIEFSYPYLLLPFISHSLFQPLVLPLLPHFYPGSGYDHDRDHRHCLAAPGQIFRVLTTQHYTARVSWRQSQSTTEEAKNFTLHKSDPMLGNSNDTRARGGPQALVWNISYLFWQLLESKPAPKKDHREKITIMSSIRIESTSYVSGVPYME